MLRNRREQGVNLSFLDVMACGLGAVILILILVKFQDNTDIPVEELEHLGQELAALEEQQSLLQQSLSEEEVMTAARTATLEALKKRLEELQIQQQDTTTALRDQLAAIADLENAIAAIAPETADDPVELAGNREESYLLGLKVEGKRIGILIDSSASMTEEALIDIIRRKIGSAAERKAGDKWQRTLRIAQWLIARIPEQSEFTVVAFNNQASLVGSKIINKASVTEDLQNVLQALAGIEPVNGTNLLAGLQEISRRLPNMTHLYLITDGLPTIVSSNAGFTSSIGCNPVEGRQPTVTGECRIKVFSHAMAANPLARVRTNIILLPLEGDPEAPGAYWNWTSRTQGTFLAPARSWP